MVKYNIQELIGTKINKLTIIGEGDTPRSEIAKIVGCSKSTIDNIIWGKSWNDI